MPFDLRARIGLDNSPLIAGLEQSKRHVAAFGGAMRSHLGNELSNLKSQVGALFGTAALISGVRSMAAFVDQVDGVSQQLGISAMEAQRFMYVADQAGTSVQKVMRAMGKEAKEFLLTQDQINEKIREFDRLGLGIKDADLERLDRLGDKLDQIELKLKKIVAGDTATRLATIVNALLEGKGFRKSRFPIDIRALVNELLGDELWGPLAQSLGEIGKSKGGAGAPPAATTLEKAKDQLQSGISLQFDALAKVGGFNQGSAVMEFNRMRDIQTRILQKLDAIERNTKPAPTGGLP